MSSNAKPRWVTLAQYELPFTDALPAVGEICRRRREPHPFQRPMAKIVRNERTRVEWQRPNGDLVRVVRAGDASPYWAFEIRKAPFVPIADAATIRGRKGPASTMKNMSGGGEV